MDIHISYLEKKEITPLWGRFIFGFLENQNWEALDWCMKKLPYSQYHEPLLFICANEDVDSLGALLYRYPQFIDYWIGKKDRGSVFEKDEECDYGFLYSRFFKVLKALEKRADSIDSEASRRLILDTINSMPLAPIASQSTTRTHHFTNFKDASIAANRLAIYEHRDVHIYKSDDYWCVDIPEEYVGRFPFGEWPSIEIANEFYPSDEEEWMDEDE
jgi:hypothetical protein